MSAPILIAGGGIGGLAAALALAQAGQQVDLFERTAVFAEIGAGIQIGPNGQKMLERLGVIDEVMRLAVFPESLVMMDSVTAQPVTTIPVGQAFRDRYRYPYTLVHRADLHGVLLLAAQSNDRITLHTGKQVSGFEESGDRVDVAFTDGGGASGAALIGADGLWSSIRQSIVGDGPPRVSGHIAYRAVLPIEEISPEFRTNTMTLWAGPKNHLVHYPLRGGKLFNLVAVFHSDRYVEGWNTEGDPEELHRRFEGTCETVRTLLAKVDTWRLWVLCDREPVENWSKGRVTLLGDAAHPMLQYLAQGAGMAMEDAVCLAECVAASENDLPAAFLRYQEQRYLRTGKCQIMARLYGEFYHAAGVRRDLRNAFLAGRDPAAAIEGLAWLYDV